MSRDRDHILEQALTHELRAAGTPDREACVDAETLGAWADGGLDAAQMASVELHVSTCARCQAMAGAFARSAPAAPGPVTSGAFSFWRWWFAPVAAAAAAVTLWMVVPEQRRLVVTPPPAAAPAQETFARSQPKDEASPPAPTPGPARSVEAPKELADLRRANATEGARQYRGERAADLSEKAKKEAAVIARKQDEFAGKPSQDKNAVAGAAAPAFVAPAVPSPSARAAQEPQAPELQKARPAFAPVVIVSPDPSRRWRIANTAIERSEDSGASWTAIRSLAGDAITGGAAPAPSICWLIGPGGLVMVTVDGLTFARVPLPERVDLTAVTATDARTATVTTADGRRFRTDDAGRTWRQNQN